MNSENNSNFGYFQAITGGILWGFSGCCGQYLFQSCGITPEWLLSIRLISTGIILLFVSLIKNRREIIYIWTEKNNVLRMLFFVAFGIIGCQYTYFSAIEASNAGLATVLQYLSPVLILLYLCIKNKKAPSVLQIAALLLAVGGTFLIATGGNIKSMNITPKALAYGLISALFLACYSIIPQPLIKKYNTLTVLGWGMLVGGIIILPVFKPWAFIPDISFGLILAMAGIIIFGTVLAYTFYLDSIKRIGADKASFLSSIEPVSAVVISAFWLKSGFSLTDIIGTCMILIMVFIISLVGKE
ncbi:MAG: DMT family transporter [Clostridia bacterium]|nr:DMT family transporter [Clostridia bacterium]